MQIKTKNVILSYPPTVDWGLKLLNIPELWKVTQGEDITVAVLDTGVYPHIQLMYNLAGGMNFVTNKPTDWGDRQGHGTHCAGIIAARPCKPHALTTNRSVIGVAPRAKILACKVLSDTGAGTNEAIADAIFWCIKRKVDIISMSLGSEEDSPILRSAIKEAYRHNIIMIAAAGNDGDEYLDDDIDYPGRYPEVICVGSVNKYLDRSWFSSDGETLDIMAPGEEILSTYLADGYAVLSGTSMATPFVAGLAALILSKHRKFKNETPIETPKQMLDHLTRFATDKGQIGRDNFYGYGIVSNKM